MKKPKKKPEAVVMKANWTTFGAHVVIVDGRVTVDQRLVDGKWVDVAPTPKGTDK